MVVRLGALALVGLSLMACEALPTLPGEGGYEMADLGIRNVRLNGAVGPVDELKSDVVATDGVSCPGELTVWLQSSETEGETQIEIALHEPIPEMEAGQTHRVESVGEDALQIGATVWADEEWTGQSVRAELVLHHLGFDVYEVAFAAVILGDQDLSQTEVSGTFRMDRLSQEGLLSGL